MRATLNRDEYEELICRGEPDEFPKNAEQVVSELKSRGYDAGIPTLDYLIRKGTVAPSRTGRNYEWKPKHVEQAAAALEEQKTFQPRTWSNLDLGISAAQRIRALRIAVWMAIDEFDAEVPESAVDRTCRR